MRGSVTAFLGSEKTKWGVEGREEREEAGIYREGGKGERGKRGEVRVK